MNASRSARGTLIASAVAVLIADAAACAGRVTTISEPSPVLRCAGVNSCKGKGSCYGANNSCKGQNRCRGKGWVELPTARECGAKGGTVLSVGGHRFREHDADVRDAPIAVLPFWSVTIVV